MPQDVFTNTGSFTWNNPGVSEVEVLVVAGGGGGGGSPHGAGGGAGGLIYRSSYAVSGDQSVTVGAGGLGGEGDNGDWNTRPGENGDNSTFGGLTAIGGGGGGAFSDHVTGSGSDSFGTYTNGDYDGQDGGSGGGATDESQPGSALQPGSVDGGFGNGSIQGRINEYSSGGGGANEAGDTDGDSHGGDGRYYGTEFGTSHGDGGYFAGGGGGAVFGNTSDPRPPGGLGGGGDGGVQNTNPLGLDAMPNTGGGGGGSERDDSAAASADAYGGDGGSGIVIVKYALTITGTATLLGNPVQGANIYAINITDGVIEDTATTDSNGNYSLSVGENKVIDVVAQYDDGTDTFNSLAQAFINT